MPDNKMIVQILRAPQGGIRKHVVDIISSCDLPEINQILITNVRDSDLDIKEILKEMRNLKIIHLNILDQPSLKDVWFIFVIFFKLLRSKVTLIHGHGAKGGLYARIAGLFLRVPVIYTPHGGSLHRVYGTLKNKVFDLVERTLIPFTDLYLFESKYSYETFSQNIHAKIKYKINYNGIDIFPCENDCYYSPHEKIKLASFGLLRHLKGHDIAILTCQLLLKENIPFEYDIYGEGDYHDTLLALITQLNLQKHVRLMGYCHHVQHTMKKYHFIIHPSRFESFGYVPVEAMALKIPVISSAEGGLKEVVDLKSGYLSLDNSPQSYFFILKEIYNDQDKKYIDKAENAYHKVKVSFSKEKMIAELLDIYLNKFSKV